MKKKNVLKKNYDFNNIINNNKPYKYKDFVIYMKNTKIAEFHFGISVGKKIGNAVTRNYYKRIIRNIISKKQYRDGFDCVIILRKSIKTKTYQEIEMNLLNAFKNINIYKEEL